MKDITIKGYTFPLRPIKNSHDRRAVLAENQIISTLHQLGIPEDNIEVPRQRLCFRKIPAKIWWYAEGYAMFFEYKLAENYAENLMVIALLLEQEVNAVLEGIKPLEEFFREYAEDDDVAHQRKEARRVLGIHEESTDLEEINKAYKHLAKKHHPDKDGGDEETFKKINNAHKVLKRELHLSNLWFIQAEKRTFK